MHAGRARAACSRLIWFCLQPFAVRLARCELLLDLLVGNDALLLQVDQQHASGLQTALVLHVLGLDRQHAGFRRHDQHVVIRDQIARRTQSIAIERRADHAAVGKRDRGGTIPRLHQRGVIFVETPSSRGCIVESASQASGISIAITCGSSRPAIVSIWTALSSAAESLPFGEMTGKIWLMSFEVAATAARIGGRTSSSRFRAQC